MRAAKQLNAARTSGRWEGRADGSIAVNGEPLAFPPQDADTEFLAFITEHLDSILATIEERYVIT